MSTITAEYIFTRASRLLYDEETDKRWDWAEFLEDLNDGQREIGVLKPESCAVTAAVQLAAGTRQAVPAGGFMMLSVLRNMGTTGTTAGLPVGLVPRRVMDSGRPGWHQDTAAAVVKHWVYEPAVNPLVYYVWPPSPGTNYLEIVYPCAPADVLPSGVDEYENVITLDDIYAPALLNYILYRAFLKDSDHAQNSVRAQGARNEFLMLIGRMDLMEAALNPHLRETEKIQPAGG